MTWVLASILIPFTTALLCLVAGRHPAVARTIGILGALALLGSSVVLLKEVIRSGYVVVQPGDWPAPFGITLVADLFSALMVMVTGLIASAVAVYSIRDIGEKLVRRHYYALFHFLLMGVNGAFITGDLFNLYVWFEVMLLSSFVLMTMGGSADQLESGVKYLIINLVSSVLFLSGVGLLYGKLGTLNMADIALRLADSPDALLVNSSAMLLLAAFGVKAALFPFFFWLPASYHTPRVATAALFAGLLTKVGIYALIRSYTLFFSSHFEAVQGILILLAAATMLTGVLGAAAHYNIRKILSFHIVSQIGYMLMGLAIGSSLAIAGAIFYTLHHIIVKANLFLIGGLIERRCGSGDLARTGGLYRSAPLLSLLFFIPAFSLGGIPPLSGFWAKFSVIKAGFDGQHYLLVSVALAVGILTLFSMTKIWAEAFWKEPEGSAPVTARSPLSVSLVLPCAVLALITVILGLWSAPLFELAMAASDQLLDPRQYIETILSNSAYENSPLLAHEASLHH